MARKLLWLSVLAAIFGFIRSYPSGPPQLESVCVDLVPDSSSPHKLQPINGRYLISTDLFFTGQFFEYLSGKTYTVEVKGIEGATFRGFIVQAWAPDNVKIGTFTPQNAQQQLVNCEDYLVHPEGTIGHNNNERVDFTSQVFSWTAPISNNGFVDFKFTVVRIRTEFFGSMSAAAMELARTTTDLTIDTTLDTETITTDALTNGTTMTDASSSEVTMTDTPTSVVPETLTDPDRAPEDYRITARFPTDCPVSECTIFVGIDTNIGESTYLDVYLEGKAQAWVAVGFTQTPNMFSADVLACNVNLNTNMVEALDTWNDQTNRFNVVDNIQNTYLRNGSFTNGRIRCTMVREIAGSEMSTRDHNLDGFYYLLYGVGMIQSAGFLINHDFGSDGNPQVSTSAVSPTVGQVNFGGSSENVNPPDSTSIEKAEVSTFPPSTELAKASEVRTTCASLLMVSILFLYSWALRV